MNHVKIFYLFLGLHYVDNGYAKSNTECASAMTAFPPDSSSGCCGKEVIESQPIDDRTTTLYQYPWLALVEYNRNNTVQLYCGGTLISGKYVLTAAHCVSGQVLSVAKPTNIRLGEYNKTNIGPDCVPNDCTEGETTIPIEKLIPHPDYKALVTSRANDIALIRMKRIVPYTDFIRPICLPTEDFTDSNGPITFVMSGFGTAYGPSAVRLHVDLPFVAKDKCQEAYSQPKRSITLSKSQFCAGGEKGKDSCKGDGGMPLMYKTGKTYNLVGIVSFGAYPCGIEEIPSVYSNIYEYISWIKRTIVV